MQHTSLRSLTLRGCCINDHGASLLADAISYGARLVELDLRWNGITKVGGRLLKKVIEPSSSCQLRYLYLGAKFVSFETNIGSPWGFAVTDCGMISKVIDDSPASKARPVAGQSNSMPMTHIGVGMKIIPGMSFRRIGTKRVHNLREIQRALSDQRKGKDGVLRFTVQSNRVPRKMIARINEKLRVTQKRTEPLSVHQSRNRSQRATAAARNMSPSIPQVPSALKSGSSKVGGAVKAAGSWLISGPKQERRAHVNAP